MSKDNKKIIDGLNKMLEQEHACAIRYATHAAVVSGPYSEAVMARLKEISGDEVMHAEKLRDRILALGGEPSMQVSTEDLVAARSLDKILTINIDEEKHAITAYTKLLADIPPENVILYQTIQEIIRDEQEHLEELEALQP
tara:strand:+ start:38887 stop:39309 length:423 start_codon:yes stop_codon:yes gene_type:complete